MDTEKVNALEVKPENKGWYRVTMHQFKKTNAAQADYVRDSSYFDGDEWDYRDRDGRCYVCFIHERLTGLNF